MSHERKRPEAPRTEKMLPGSGGCGCRCPGPGCRTATSGRSRPTAASSSSTPGSAARGGCASSTSPSPRPASASRTSASLVCTHSHTDHYGLAAPIVESAGCELWMHPAWEHVRLLADDPAAALEQRIEVARQSGVPPAALERYREARKGDDETGIDAIVEPDRDLAPRGRGRDRPRHLAGLRDPRPRALARRPAPARAQADDLRRPPARPHRALLRPRPHAPTRSASSSRSLEEVEPLEVGPRACPATAVPSATRRRRSPRRGARSSSCSASAATRSPRGSGPPSRSSPRSSGPRTSTRRPAPGRCRSSSPASITWRSSARSAPVEGTDPAALGASVASRADGQLHLRARGGGPAGDASSRCSPTTAATPSMTPVRQVELEREGEPAPNGVGAIRVLQVGRAAAARGSARLRGAHPLLLQAALRGCRCATTSAPSS